MTEEYSQILVTKTKGKQVDKPHTTIKQVDRFGEVLRLLRVIPVYQKAYLYGGTFIGWRIEEVVTRDGLYIEWPELFDSSETAQRYAIQRLRREEADG
jgi:hypothetical protein